MLQFPIGFIARLLAVALIAVTPYLVSASAQTDKALPKILKQSKHPNELLVKFRPGVTAQDMLLIARKHNAKKTKAFKHASNTAFSPMDRWRRMTFANNRALAQASERLSRHADVEIVDLDVQMYRRPVAGVAAAVLAARRGPGALGLFHDPEGDIA